MCQTSVVPVELGGCNISRLSSQAHGCWQDWHSNIGFYCLAVKNSFTVPACPRAVLDAVCERERQGERRRAAWVAHMQAAACVEQPHLTRSWALVCNT